MRRMQKKALLTLLMLAGTALVFFYYAFVHSGFATEQRITAEHVHGFRPASGADQQQHHSPREPREDESFESVKQQMELLEHQGGIDRLVKDMGALAAARAPTRRPPRIAHRFHDDESVSVSPDDPDAEAPSWPLNHEAAEEAYARAAGSDITADCRPHDRFGAKGDGGWEVCLAGPYRPRRNACLSVSFGVGDIWDYDDQVANRLGCQTLAFDPSLTRLQNHTRAQSGVKFYRLGLWSRRGRLPGIERWPVDTLQGLLDSLAGGPRAIVDLLKLDIEGAEWPSLDVAIESGTLSGRVKQLMVELHSKETRPRPNKDTHIKDYMYYLDVLHRLRKAGFQMWRSEPNLKSWFYSSDGHRKRRFCCYNAYFINTRFLPAVNVSQALLEDKLLLDMHSSSLPTQHQVRLRLPLKLPDLPAHRSSPNLAERLFFDLMLAVHADCPDWRRLGPQSDSGYDVCLSEPYALTRNKCLVYSFGIGDQYGFEDQLADAAEFGCQVRMFDPSLTQLGEHKRGPRQWVHLVGLGPADGVRGDGWTLGTLQSLLRRFQHEEVIVDLIKIDIELDEWDSLDTAIDDRSLTRVKQLIVETHTKELHDGITKPADYLRFTGIWLRLYRLGFRQWRSRENARTHFLSSTGGKRACCHEHSLININFL